MPDDHLTHAPAVLNPQTSDQARPQAPTPVKTGDRADQAGDRPEPTGTGLRVVLTWAGTRAAMITIWLVALVVYQVPSARGDVAYYFRAISGLASRGPAATMIEYPTPVVALTWLMYELSRGNDNAFLALFVGLMVAVDGAFTWTLWRHAGGARRVAVWFWIAFVFLLGPTVLLRFDLLPGVLTALAMLAATRSRPKPGLAGAMVAAATALKLWPAATWPGTWGPDRRTRWRSALGASGVGAVVVITSGLWAGWARLLTPLTWQSDRGLQIESVFATVPMIGRALHPEDYLVAMSSFQAFEIAGPGTATWLSLASLGSMVGYLVIASLSVLLWRRGVQDASAAVIVMVLASVVLVVANKTFSPQYMLWIGAPVAAGLARLGSVPLTDRDGSTIRLVGVMVLVLAAATALIYPIGYRPLIYGLPGVVLVTAILSVRNLGMLVLLAVLLRWAWHSVVQRRSA